MAHVHESIEWWAWEASYTQMIMCLPCSYLGEPGVGSFLHAPVCGFHGPATKFRLVTNALLSFSPDEVQQLLLIEAATNDITA